MTRSEGGDMVEYNWWYREGKMLVRAVMVRKNV
jgi:hypothetical protein